LVKCPDTQAELPQDGAAPSAPPKLTSMIRSALWWRVTRARLRDPMGPATVARRDLGIDAPQFDAETLDTTQAPPMPWIVLPVPLQ